LNWSAQLRSAELRSVELRSAELRLMIFSPVAVTLATASEITSAGAANDLLACSGTEPRLPQCHHSAGFGESRRGSPRLAYRCDCGHSLGDFGRRLRFPPKVAAAAVIAAISSGDISAGPREWVAQTPAPVPRCSCLVVSGLTRRLPAFLFRRRLALGLGW